ncbi:hypothetical protein Pfo_021732 [Paulownia fortunei]|nr:hypothetical protein Pfo_021732 [Paulownia fortunei]
MSQHDFPPSRGCASEVNSLFKRFAGARRLKVSRPARSYPCRDFIYAWASTKPTLPGLDFIYAWAIMEPTLPGLYLCPGIWFALVLPSLGTKSGPDMAGPFASAHEVLEKEHGDETWYLARSSHDEASMPCQG